MRSIVLVAVFLALCQTAFSDTDLERENRILEDTIQNAVTCVLGELQTGVEECSVPSFSPLVVEAGEIDLGSFGISGISGVISVANLVLDGVTDLYFQALKGSITIIPIGYKIEATPKIDSISLDTSYTATDCTYGSVVFYGSGQLAFECQGFSITFVAQLTVIGGINVEIKSLSATADSCSNFVITGVYNDEEYSEYLSQLVVSDAASVLQTAQAFIKDLIAGIVDNIISGLTRSFVRDDADFGCLMDKCL